MEALLGISGYAGAGKDALADLLVEHFGFVKMAFADPMRDIASAIDPVVGWVHDGPVRYNDAVEFHGYDDAKFEYPEVRQFLQRLGTEGGREILGENIWVDTGLGRAQAHRRVVFSDMRFQNEAEAIKAAGGRTVRVERPGVGPANDHTSEHDLAKWAFDLYVNNNGTVGEMVPRLEQFFGRHYIKVLRIT